MTPAAGKHDFATPRTPPSIRRAIAADAGALTALMRAASAYHGDYAAILDGYAVSPAQIAVDHVFVCEDGVSLLGFYSLTCRGDAPELDLMFVADAAQGRGIGAALFAHMNDHARALGIARVTIVSHPPAEHFYRRMGAERVGTQPPAGRVAWARPILVLDVA